MEEKKQEQLETSKKEVGNDDISEISQAGVTSDVKEVFQAGVVSDDAKEIFQVGVANSDVKETFQEEKRNDDAKEAVKKEAIAGEESSLSLNQDEFDKDDDDFDDDDDEMQVQEIEPAVYEVDTKIGTGELYSYLMMHGYSSLSGKIRLILSFLALIMLLLGAGKGDMTKTLILGVVAALYTVINPVMLYMKALRQAKLNPAYKNAMKFGFHEKGVNISFGDNKGMILWDKITKIKKTKKVYALYTDPIHAFLIATKDLQRTQVGTYIEEHVK